jgi:hypothetical protein
MGTYFALMDEAARRGEEYQDLDRIREILFALHQGEVKPSKEDIEYVIKHLEEWRNRVIKLKSTQPEAAGQALVRLEDLKSYLEASLSAVHS